MANPDDPAFHQQYVDREGNPKSCGLTKREYFAGQALRGAIEWHGYHVDPLKTNINNIAKDCVAMAAALIKALNEEGK